MVNVSKYSNQRLKIKFRFKNDIKDFTLDLPHLYLEDNEVFLNPFLLTTDFKREIFKTKIIKEIVNIIDYQGTKIPVAILNMGVLRKYDNSGVEKYLEKDYFHEF